MQLSEVTPSGYYLTG